MYQQSELPRDTPLIKIAIEFIGHRSYLVQNKSTAEALRLAEAAFSVEFQDCVIEKMTASLADDN